MLSRGPTTPALVAFARSPRSGKTRRNRDRHRVNVDATMAREEKRWCYFDGANGRRRPTRIPLLLVVLCTLLAGSLAAAEHGECRACLCTWRARGRVCKCHLHICVHMRRCECAHGRLSITCCVSQRILFGTRAGNARARRRKRRLRSQEEEKRRRNGDSMERASKRELSTSKTSSFFCTNDHLKSDTETSFTLAKGKRSGTSDHEELAQMLGVGR